MNDDSLNKIINIMKKHHLLFISATPKIDELENNHDYDVNKILGKIIYKMDFKCAIEKKYLVIITYIYQYWRMIL